MAGQKVTFTLTPATSAVTDSTGTAQVKATRGGTANASVSFALNSLGAITYDTKDSELTYLTGRTCLSTEINGMGLLSRVTNITGHGN